MKIKKILVSQPRPSDGKSPYYDIGAKYNVKIEFRPFIKVEPLSSKEFRAQRINILDFSAVIFITKQGIDYFFKLCEELRIVIPETMKYFCISESVAVYLQYYIHLRKRKVFFGANAKIQDLVVILKKHSTEKFLFVTPEVLNEETIVALDHSKIAYTKAVMYRTVSNDFAPHEAFDYDMLLFFSPFGVQSLLKNFPDFKQGDIQIGCFGASTANAIKEANLRLDLEVPTPEHPSMTMALDAFLKDFFKKKKNGTTHAE